MKTQSGEATITTLHWSQLLATAWALVLGLWCLTLPGDSTTSSQNAPGTHDQPHRTVLVIVDSLRPQNVNATLMPNLHALNLPSVNVHTCSANFTLPCTQTMLEGKQSPFAAGLSNFTGTEGSAASLPSIWHQTDKPVRMISDHTLDSLYGNFAAESINVEKWPGTHLDRDIQSLQLATRWATEHPNDHLLVHVVGTDKVTHHQHVGSDAYNAHWQAVDRELQPLLNALAPDTQVIITGDHGHGELGHHTRDSVALFKGKALNTALDAAQTSQIEQTDLLFFLTFASGVTLPRDYEGHFWESPLTASFTDAHRRHLNIGHGSVAQAFANNHALKQQNVRRYPVQNAGAILIGALAFAAAVRRTGPLSKKNTLELAAASLAALATVWMASAWLGIAVSAAALAYLFARFDSPTRRLGAIALTTLGLAALTSAFAEPWRDFFHTRGGIQGASLVFYALLILAGLAGSWLASRSARFTPEAAALFGILVMPSGVYFYQSGQNFLSGVVMGSVLTAAAALRAGFRPSKKDIFPLLTLALGLVFVMLQEAGGWEWKFFPHRWLASIGHLGGALISAALGLVVSRLVPGLHKVAGATALAVAFGYAVLVGELPPERFVTAMGLVTFLSAWWSWTERQRADLSQSQRDWAHAIILLAGQLFVGWMMIDGYRLNSVDFSFALDWFGHIANEAVMFALTQTAAVFKYAMPVLLMLVALRAVVGPRRFVQVTYRALLLGFFEFLVLIVQILLGQAFQTERMWELGVTDLMMEANLVLMIPLMAVPIVALDAWSRRKSPTSPEPHIAQES